MMGVGATTGMLDLNDAVAPGKNSVVSVANSSNREVQEEDIESPGETATISTVNPLDTDTNTELPSITHVRVMHLVPLSSTSTYALASFQLMLQAYMYIVFVQTYLLHLYATILLLFSQPGRVGSSYRR